MMAVSSNYKFGENYKKDILHLLLQVMEPMVPNQNDMAVLLVWNHLEEYPYQTHSVVPSSLTDHVYQ